MAKYSVLIILFALPLVAYLFFLQGKHNFDTLPVINEEIGTLENFKTLEGRKLQLKDSITIITFLGNHPYERLGHVSNVNEKIYKEFHKFDTFQLVAILPEAGVEDVQEIKNQMAETTDISDFHFLVGDDSDILKFFDDLGSDLELNKDLSSDYAFIIDKSASLRGRDDNDPEESIIYGYDTSSIPALQKVMVDDVRVLLAEYRFAFKKNRDQKIQKDGKG
ncbi:membrane or secreted protein [Nonlabens spongiae]|uniref:Membrane or secreted protein n=1 Tax=Nonlabens spongiae TaxID=331648 RepID=A0A1W6MP94_9FLAO|nr:membrane or secreted protein [Nonlabens spongiae]